MTTDSNILAWEIQWLGHLLEGSLEYEGTTRRGTNTPVHHPEKRAGYTHLSPPELPQEPPRFLLSSDYAEHISSLLVSASQAE